MSLAKTFLAMGIAIIFAVFVSYGLYIIYESPKDYYYGSSNCLELHDCQNLLSRECGDYAAPGYQNCWNRMVQSTPYQTCQTEYDNCYEESLKKDTWYIHSRNSFYILWIIGIIAIVAGILLSSMEGIGSGLMGGGVLVVLWSLLYTMDYWLTLNKYIKLVALGIVLAILIYLGYKKLEKKLNKPRKKR